MYLKRNILVLDRLWSGTSYSDVGHEFDVNGSTNILDKVSLNRHSHKQGLCINRKL